MTKTREAAEKAASKAGEVCWEVARLNGNINLAIAKIDSVGIKLDKLLTLLQPSTSEKPCAACAGKGTQTETHSSPITQEMIELVRRESAKGKR